MILSADFSMKMFHHTGSHTTELWLLARNIIDLDYPFLRANLNSIKNIRVTLIHDVFKKGRQHDSAKKKYWSLKKV